MPPADDLFAPPTAREIEAAKKAQSDLFAPPTKEEIAAATTAGTGTPQRSIGEKAQATLEGFGQGALSGYLPNVQAAAERYLVPNPTADLDKKLQSQGVNLVQPKDDYVTLRDQNIQRQAMQAKDMPGYYYGGGVAGALASAPLYGKALGVVPGLGSAAAQGLLKSTGQAALGGAVQGAIQNPGDTEGELSSLQVPERFHNAVTGAVAGGVANIVGQGMKRSSDFIFNTPERLKEWAELKAAKSSGMMLKDYRIANAKSPSFDPEARVKEIGQNMIKNGLVKPGSTFDDVAQKSLELKQKAGSVIGDVYDTASQELGKLNPRDLSPKQRSLISSTSLDAADWSEELTGQFAKKLKGKAGGTAAMGAIQTALGELAQNGNKSNILKIQEFKSDLDGLINYNKRFDDTPLKNEYLYKIRSFINDKIQSRIGALDQILGSDRVKSLKEANQQYGIWSEVNRISQDRVNRESANRFASLTDTIAGVGGAGAGVIAGAALHGDTEGAVKGGALGLGLGVANHLARRYGNPFAVNAANSIGRGLQAIPNEIPTAGRAVGGFLAKDPRLLGAMTSRFVNPPQNKKGGLIP